MAGNTRFGVTNWIEDSNTTLLNGPAVVVGVIAQWTNGSANVTRAAGSWFTDGVKPWSLVGGNLATRFPASTRVQSVGATTLVMTAAATAAGSGTDSASFTPTYPLEEDVNFPTSNLQYPRRNVRWATGPTPTFPLSIEYDLGSNRLIAVFAGLASETLDALTSTLGFSSVALYTGTVYGSYTLQGSKNFALPYRDKGGPLASSVSHRFVRFQLGGVGPATAATVWAGPIGQDLGVALWPGSAFRHEDNVARGFTGGMLQAFFNRGPARRVMRFGLDGINETQRAQIFTVFGAPLRKPLLIDPDDECWEVALVDDSLEWIHRFNDYRSQILALETLR